MALASEPQAPAPTPLLAIAACAATVVLGIAACARGRSEAHADPATARIVTVGGAVTETVFALGAGERVIAVDSSSVYPEVATRRTIVGYQRTLAAEGILALEPTLVVAAAEAGPASTLEALRRAGVRVEIMPAADSIATTGARIRAIGAAIGSADTAATLATSVEAAATRATEVAPRTKRRVLFIYARGGGTTMVSGKGTPAAAMLTLAGAESAITAWDGFRPLTAEAVVDAAPDVVLLPSRGLDALGGIDGVLALPGLAATPAGAARRVITLDDQLLLGFGPRLPAAIDELARALAAP